jgi:xylose dehydrogenase (NAD/NADP)
MARDALNWGLLSTARINRALIPALNDSRRSRLQAVASREAERAEAYARERNIPRAYGSYEALLADPEIDVIYNSLPNHMHADWSIKALGAGKHVLCEKPLALSVSEVDAVAAAARETGRVLAEAFMYRHHAQTLRVQEICAQGGLGKLHLIKGAFTFTLLRAGDIRLKKELGGGSIWDVGCYPISYARMLAREEPVEAVGWQVLADGGTDATFVGQLRFPSGLIAQIDCGFAAPTRAYMEIVGSDGVLYVPMPFKPGTGETISLRRGDLTETIVVDGGELYSGEVQDMEGAILDGKPTRVSLRDSRGNVAAIVGLLESARSGKPVSL